MTAWLITVAMHGTGSAKTGLIAFPSLNNHNTYNVIDPYRLKTFTANSSIYHVQAKFQIDIFFLSQFMSCQICAIRKAIEFSG